MERSELAQFIYDKLNSSEGLCVAAYPAKLKSAAEFERQATQFALDRQAIGLKNGVPYLGVALKIERNSLPQLLATLSTAIDALLQDFPEITGEQSVAVKFGTLGIFTHGEPDQIQAAKIGTKADGTEENQWIKNSLPDWAKGLAPFLRNTVQVVLYACSAAATPKSGGNSFAELLRQNLATNLANEYDARDIVLDVWAHKDSGHTTANNRLVQFYGGLETVNGIEMIPLYTEWLTGFALSEQGINAAPGSSAYKAASTHCLSIIRKSLSGLGFEGSKDPINNFIRDIPLMGMNRVWTDMVGDHDLDYSDQPISADAQIRLTKGADTIRKRFSKEWASLLAQVI